ncbi:serine/threonine-protein phosphatase family protein [Coniella lustricola]|uniref:Serine/threonine-protein phosphatase family protein n=1 Tax=Coniella lustricola TaxID=2025994 RepID=A0A2T2ZW97_9PEZI|nr:serine/threonine-protein phosphatase family protein [Coniella lustricola]
MPPENTLRYRKTRFVCISDTHNQTPRLPSGDVLIHAGDLTNQGSISELSKTVKWLERADFEAKIVIAGNHDVTLDKQFYEEYGSYFHNQSVQSPDECLDLLTASPSITYLNHSSAAIELTKSPNLKVSFNVFGSPYSPRCGMWAFGYDETSHSSSDSRDANRSSEKTAADLWSAIPLDSDIVVTHTPPYHHCDEFFSKRRAMGCEDLRRALWRVRPRLAVCGHVHEGRGVERVRWDLLGKTKAPYAELEVARWEDPSAAQGSKKLSLVNLTARSSWEGALDNDGSHSTQQGITALGGRMGRKETCVVNCSIAATSWPHAGGKRFNKPIVVDLELPIIAD